MYSLMSSIVGVGIQLGGWGGGGGRVRTFDSTPFQYNVIGMLVRWLVRAGEDGAVMNQELDVGLH